MPSLVPFPQTRLTDMDICAIFFKTAMPFPSWTSQKAINLVRRRIVSAPSSLFYKPRRLPALAGSWSGVEFMTSAASRYRMAGYLGSLGASNGLSNGLSNGGYSNGQPAPQFTLTALNRWSVADKQLPSQCRTITLRRELTGWQV